MCVFSSLNDPENGVHHYKCCLPEGDDGWLHQPCCLLIKWLLLNSNLPVWCSSKPHWLTGALQSISLSHFILFHQLAPPVERYRDQGTLLLEWLASQQAVHSEKSHKCSFIHSVTKHHQREFLFSLALRQTHPVLFCNEKLPVPEIQGAKEVFQ